ncbi:MULTISPECIES: hypothetical protein [unclassified Microcoleus]|uniref:hypothetical protein n=1 Tax=unclassified Microcoleus TaxID=2642155 RepID=UPI001DFA9B5B|nr:MULTISPECIES: hypothetical protein [unclassified Microcoleus]MCC3412662.1 hypothetical protein [Microcoleus sp. PH2017_02_FOX_O_A]MCC3492674.1 hypothetical protein [Microcoleus sp. PH2017_16_JOR_D_A]MCC3516267.1 hypothetical protein [Microcoleus sp. PH2017_18_LLB_O_A]MCC3536741.1 hypothetical protein [Microcoleus sp. PH2017_25_DOB_D_A]MCC3548933.1 hypothetical protein [Microcoleus sp. PH2017_24_DOB_U_A]
MPVIETSIDKAWGFLTYFFHTLIKQRQFFSQFLETHYADCFKAAIALPIYSDTAESSAPWETTSTPSC